MFEAFQFGPLILWTHLLFLLLGIWLSAEFFFRLAQSAGLSLQHFQDHWWQHLLAFILGGRLFAVLAEYKAYFDLDEPLRIFKLHDGSFSFLGGMIGIAVVLFIIRRSSRITFLQWLDVLLPATCFGLSFDWLGKFAAGIAYGRPTNVFWGITYDAINVRYVVPIHPVQLYYAFFFFALTFFLLVVRKHAERSGAETLAGIVMASIATFFFEFFRGDFGIPVFASFADFIMLLLLFVSLGFFTIFEPKLSQRSIIILEAGGTILCMAYLFARPWMTFETYQLFFSQLLALLALLASILYVVVHRQRHPHL